MKTLPNYCIKSKQEYVAFIFVHPDVSSIIWASSRAENNIQIKYCNKYFNNLFFSYSEMEYVYVNT